MMDYSAMMGTCPKCNEKAWLGVHNCDEPLFKKAYREKQELERRNEEIAEAIRCSETVQEAFSEQFNENFKSFWESYYVTTETLRSEVNQLKKGFNLVKDDPSLAAKMKTGMNYK